MDADRTGKEDEDNEQEEKGDANELGERNEDEAGERDEDDGPDKEDTGRATESEQPSGGATASKETSEVGVVADKETTRGPPASIETIRRICRRRGHHRGMLPRSGTKKELEPWGLAKTRCLGLQLQYQVEDWV